MLENFFRNWNKKRLKNKKYDFLFDEPLPNGFNPVVSQSKEIIKY